MSGCEIGCLFATKEVMCYELRIWWDGMVVMVALTANNGRNLIMRRKK